MNVILYIILYNIINSNIWKVLQCMPWKFSLHVFSFLISAKFVVCITDSWNYRCIEAFWLNNECLKTNKKDSYAFSAYFAFLISPSVSEDFFCHISCIVYLAGKVYTQHQKLAWFIRYFMTESNWQNFLSFPVRLFTSSRRVVMNGLYGVIN